MIILCSHSASYEHTYTEINLFYKRYNLFIESLIPRIFKLVFEKHNSYTEITSWKREIRINFPNKDFECVIVEAFGKRRL